MISEDVGDDEKGGLEHEGKGIDEESENPWEIAVKGARRSVPALAEGGGVQVHDRISFEGLFGEYGEYGDQKSSCKTAEHDCGDCGGSYTMSIGVRSSRGKKTRKKRDTPCWLFHARSIWVLCSNFKKVEATTANNAD